MGSGAASALQSEHPFDPDRMIPRLLIRLLPEGAAEWLALGRDGRVLDGPQRGWPTEAAEQRWVLVPSEAVLLLRAPRVARSRRQLEQAVPFAIEEQLAAPVEQMHVALDASTQGEDLGVAVVSVRQLESWMTQLRDAGIEPDHLIPESLLLPHDVPTVLVDGDRAILRHAPSGAITGALDEVTGWIELLGADSRRPARLRWIGPATSVPPGIAVDREESTTPLHWFATQLDRTTTIDLLQGAHAPKRGRDDARRVWRWAAMLAAAALFAALGQAALESWQLQQRHAAARAEMEQLLRRAVPGITRIVDPRAQLAAEQARAGRGTGGGLLPMLARIAPSLSGSGRYTIDGLEFRGDTLELVIRGPDIATLDGLREMLSALSLQVELTGATPGTGGVEGRLRIRSGA
jgi:general secretion pathway protein L